MTERILVTGASGFIGHHLCRQLVAGGHSVTGTCHAHPNKLPDGVKGLTADLTDPAAVQRLIATVQPAVVFHLASCVQGARSRELVRPTFLANLASTVYLLEALAEQGCKRFVVTGSLEEPEQVHDAPSSPYAAAKVAASAYARMFHALYALPTVVARVFMVYGPGQRDQHKLIPYVINSLLRGESPHMGSGTRPVDWIYVVDVVQGLVRLAEHPAAIGQTVDIGSGQTATIRHVAERIASLMDAAAGLQFEPAADRPLEQVRVADVERTAALIDWRPTTALDEGLRSVIDWQRRLQAPTTGTP